MSDNNVATQFPQGIQAPNISGLGYMSFDKNMTIDTTPSPIVVTRKDGEYNVLIDEGELINGFYIIDFSMNRKRFNLVVAVSGQGRNTGAAIDNSVNIISVLNEDPSLFKFKELSLAQKIGTTSVGIILTMTAISTVYDAASVEITGLSTQGRLSPSTNYNLFERTVVQRKYGYVNSVEVKDDAAGVNVDLNSISFSSIVYCNPATPGSRPNANGKGVCQTIAGTYNASMGAQMFISEENEMYFRSKVNGAYGFWTQIYTTKIYPKVVAAGSAVTTFSPTSPFDVSVPGIDLSRERFVILTTPEKISAVCGGVEVTNRANGSFGLVAKNDSGGNWTGKINWTIMESYSSSEEMTYSLQMGILQGSAFIESTTVSEGQMLRVIVNAPQNADGSLLAYNITQVSQSDIGIPLSGNVEIRSGNGIVDIPIVQDFLPEATEKLRFTLSASNTFKEIDVIDVSGPPEYASRVSRYADGSNTITQANEGDTVYLVLETKYVANGTEFTFTSSSDSDISNIVEFGTPRNINNNLIIVPVTLEADPTKPYEGTETITLEVRRLGAVVTSTALIIIDTAWKAETWYSTNPNGTDIITQSDEGKTVYLILRVPSGTLINTYFKPTIKSVSTTGEIVEGQDVDITNSTMVAKQYTGNMILAQKIEIIADKKTEGDELLLMEWVNQTTSQVVGDSNKQLLVKDTSLTPVMNMYLSGSNLTDVDLKSLFEAQFGTQDVAWICNLYITGECWFTASSTLGAALRNVNWLAGTEMNIFWNSTGGVVGKGGKGASPGLSQVGANGGPCIEVGSGLTLNLNISTSDCIIASGGGGGGGVAVNGKNIGGGGGASTGAAGTGDYNGVVATRTIGGDGGSYSYTDPGTSVTTVFNGGKGGDAGLSGSVATGSGSNTAAGTYGNIKSGSGTLVIKKNGSLITSSQYYNENSYIRGGW